MKWINWTYIILIVGAAGAISSCNNLKKIPAGDALYTGHTVKIDSTPLNRKQKNSLASELKALVRPKPNTKFLGMRLKLSAYYLAGNPKKESSLMGWLKYKVGEPPVLLSQVNLERNVIVLQNTLENSGYFNATVRGDTIVKTKTASAVYTVQTGNRYYINETHFDTSQNILERTILEKAGETLLKPGQPFDLSTVKDERLRIDGELKEKGFFYFDPSYLIIRVDSTIGNSKVNLYVKVKPETSPAARIPYRINDIFLFPGYRLNPIASDTAKKDMVFHKGYYVLDRQELYKPRMFEDAIQFKTGELYNRTDHNATLSRLINLNVFRFVKNRLEMVTDSDSAELNSYYYLTPMARQALRGELDASTKSNSLTGSSLTIGWRKRNALRAGELLSIDANGGFEVQFGGQFKGYNTFRAGLQGTLSFPRFLVPFHIKPKTSGFLPKTNIIAGYDILTKQKLYTLNSLKASYGFSWKRRFESEHVLNPFVITYVQPAQVTEEYKDSIRDNPTLATSIEEQFIIGANYTYNYSELKNNIFKTGIYFNGNFDVSGNIPGLISGADIKNGNPKKIFGAVYSQYLKAETDFRYYLKLAPKSVLANRIILGGSIPYGNSFQLPYVKQFFSGGNSSVRAFPSRSIGPGTYRVPDTVTSFRADQGGDMKIELNTEWRFRLFSIVYGALFVDAGNVWVLNDNPLKPGSQFSSDFLSELAVGGGLGLRFDISFLVLRLDLATPFRKPYLAKGSRWVFSSIKPGDPSWRKENLIFNLGIGYPF